MARRTALTIIMLALLSSAITGTLSVYATEDSLVSKAQMNEARTGAGVAVVDGKIYVIGGANQEGFRATNEEYDPAKGVWNFKAQMPTPRSYFGIAVYQNKIYCIGGYIPWAATGVNEVYDPETDTWEAKAPMPTPTLNLQANVVNGRIYLIGGNSNGTLNQVYDPANDTWLTKASVPTAVSSYASAVVNNKIYVITSNLNQIYDAENDSWSLGAPAPLPAILGSAGATTGVNAPERVYVFGADANLPYWQLTTRKFVTQSYDPKNDSWTICASMPIERYGAGIAVVDDLLYVIGGFTLTFHTDKFTLNPIYTYSAVSQQYTPFGYGTVPPKIAVISPENGNHTSGNVSLAFTVNKPAMWTGYSLDGQDNVTVAGNVTLSGLSSGLHNVTVYAKDQFENTGATDTVTFSIAEEPAPFPTAFVTTASVASVSVIAVGLLIYSRNTKH